MALTYDQKELIMRLFPYMSNRDVAEIVGVSEYVVWKFGAINRIVKQDFQRRNKKGEKPDIERGRHHRYIVCPTPYWELVKQYKEQTPLRRFNHPFFESTKKIYKTKENGTD